MGFELGVLPLGPPRVLGYRAVSPHAPSKGKSLEEEIPGRKARLETRLLGATVNLTELENSRSQKVGAPWDGQGTARGYSGQEE